jgi:hypothetical protein
VAAGEEDVPDEAARRVWVSGEHPRDTAVWLTEVCYWVSPEEAAVVAVRYEQARDAAPSSGAARPDGGGQ